MTCYDSLTSITHHGQFLTLLESYLYCRQNYYYCKDFLEGITMKTEYDRYLNSSEHDLDKLLDSMSDFIREHLEKIDELDRQEQKIINSYAERIDIPSIRAIDSMADKMIALKKAMNGTPLQEPGAIKKLVQHRLNEYELLRKLMLLMLAFPYKILINSGRSHYLAVFNASEDSGYRLKGEEDHIRMKDNALNYPLTKDSFEEHEFNIEEFKEIIQSNVDALLKVDQ